MNRKAPRIDSFFKPMGSYSTWTTNIGSVPGVENANPSEEAIEQQPIVDDSSNMVVEKFYPEDFSS